MAIACDSASLVAAAKCFDCIPPAELLGVQTYLLALKAGITDYRALVASAKCFEECIPHQYQTAVQNYLLTQILAVGTGTAASPDLTPAALVAAAKCFEKCIPPGLQLAVQTYCLAVLAGGSTDPKVLFQAAKCFVSCLPLNLELAVQDYLLCQVANGASASFLVVLDWASRVVANGGAVPSTSTINALTTFYAALVTAGIQASYYTLNAFVPDSDIAARTPLIAGIGRGLYLGGGNGYSRNGYTAVGASLQSGVNPSSVFSVGTGAFSVYVYTLNNSAIPNSANFGFGCRDTTNSRFFDFEPASATNLITARAFSSSTGANVVSQALPSPSAGYYSWNRTASNNADLYHAQSGYAHASAFNRAAANAATPPNFEAYFCGENVDGVDTVDSSRTYSFGAIHVPFSATQSLAQFNAVQALRVALGGGWN